MNKYLFYNFLWVQIEINGVSNPHGKFCLWTMPVAINMSVAFCQVATCKVSSFGKMSNENKLVMQNKAGDSVMIRKEFPGTKFFYIVQILFIILTFIRWSNKIDRHHLHWVSMEGKLLIQIWWTKWLSD